MIARLTGEARWLEVSRGLADTVLSLPVEIPWYSQMARVALALVAVEQADVPAARKRYNELAVIPGIKLNYVCTDRILGLLAGTIGQLDQAAAHFEDALAFCHRAGYRPELGWSCHDYAELLLQRNGAGDPARAMSLLDESLAISTELGMSPLMERVARLQNRAASLPSIAPAYPAGLTQREVEVLRLIAAGKTDRDIAEDLIISPRTVTTHVRNILNKTACSNRTEAATYAVRQRLV